MKIVVDNPEEERQVQALCLKLMDALGWPHPVGCACSPCCRRDADGVETITRYLAGEAPIRTKGFREPPANGHGGPA